MCEYENPVVTYQMNKIRKNLNQLIENLIQLKYLNVISEKSELITNELMNISKFIEILKRKENINE